MGETLEYTPEGELLPPLFEPDQTPPEKGAIVFQVTAERPIRRRNLPGVTKGGEEVKLPQDRVSQIVVAWSEQEGRMMAYPPKKLSRRLHLPSHQSDFPTISQDDPDLLAANEEMKPDVKGARKRKTGKVLVPMESFGTYIGPPDAMHPQVPKDLSGASASASATATTPAGEASASAT